MTVCRRSQESNVRRRLPNRKDGGGGRPSVSPLFTASFQTIGLSYGDEAFMDLQHTRKETKTHNTGERRPCDITKGRSPASNVYHTPKWCKQNKERTESFPTRYTRCFLVKGILITFFAKYYRSTNTGLKLSRLPSSFYNLTEKCL